MKIKSKELDYSEVLKLPKEKHQLPKRPPMFFRLLMKFVGRNDIKATSVEYNEIGIKRLGKNEPCLILMNHSCFLDLEIATTYFYPRPMNIVCTSDGFVGKKWLMRNLGCIPTMKFVTDFTLVKDISYAVKKLNDSILMYPEASYTFDGTATPLPESIGKFAKSLNIPLIIVRTHGAFIRDPLYNGLKVRDVKVTADIEYVFSPDEMAEKTADEITEAINFRFTFDNFREQQENGIEVKEEFRAEGLNRVLYKCPVCGTEGQTEGIGTKLICHQCDSKWELEVTGNLRFEGEKDSKLNFDHVPDWYAWEREEVRKELESGEYNLSVPVDIAVMVDTKAIYKVGEGLLEHTEEGFHLSGCNGRIDYTQKPLSSYSLYADYFWYEMGDVICIGGRDALYYCFPKGTTDIVAKTRLATEELYKIKKNQKKAVKA